MRLETLYRVAIRDLIPGMELVCMLFRRYLSNFTKTSRIVPFPEFNPDSSPGRTYLENCVLKYF